MKQVKQPLPERAPANLRPHELLLLAAWFGLAGGLLEGFFAWTLQQARWVAWSRLSSSVDLNILWASALVNTLLFVVLGAVLLPVLTRWGRWPALAAALFGTLTAYGWLSTSGRLRERGVIMLSLGLGAVAWRWMERAPARRLTLMRRSVVPLVLICLLAWVSVNGGERIWEKVQVARLPQPPANTPNVLLIVLDTLRADHVGSYGYPRPTTPNLDAFAKQGVLFEKTFANASWTLPSHTSIFTGRLPSEHGAGLWPYDGRFPTLAEIMSQHGFATGGFVANQLMCSAAFGLSRGFQRWKNLSWGWGDIFTHSTFGLKFHKLYRGYLNSYQNFSGMSAPEVNERFLSWLDGRDARPFFAFLNYMEVHEPTRPPREFAARFSDDPEALDRTAWRKPQKYPYQSPGFRRLALDSYDASLAYLDSQIGALLEELRKRNLDQNTLVIITSDHGESLGEHGLDGHRSALYLEQIRVPLLLRFPGRIPENRRVPGVAGLQDLASTIAEMAGVQKHPFPGVSLASRWSGGETSGDELFAVSELDHFPFSSLEKWPCYHGAIKSIISSRWHYISHQKFGVELFDWNQDAQETQNLAKTEEGARIAAEYGAQLQKRLTSAQHSEQRLVAHPR
ncbi:MAG: sulfatase [Acidobacteria bacterium]|nr:sulfatase [Acidobacteriota bacterium]MCL5288129.1 sulfatase [Acidobacteriota bacterium]